jgi:CDGSH-type Zn-finger protein
MVSTRRDPTDIPSFFQALRCTCGKARQGPYCDGSHLEISAGLDCQPDDPPEPTQAQPERGESEEPGEAAEHMAAG